MRIRSGNLVAALALVFSIVSVPAHAFDLTGHWQGKWSCKGFSAEFMDHGKPANKYATSNKASTLAITQSGANFAAKIDNTYAYNGVGMTDVKDDQKGEVVILGCLDANTLPGGNGSETLRAQVKTKNGTPKATLSGISIYADSYPEVETCKYSYKRIDTTDPAVAACP